jgi:SSS family solute:Na+ symporter
VERMVLASHGNFDVADDRLFSNNTILFMNVVDWIVLFSMLALIVGYGAYKSKGSKNMEGYLLGNNSMPWWSVCLSIMATQASAVTFLSTPGQAYEDGMRFLQFYFGLPLAMVILSITAVPLYHTLKVFTAYEYLETRFDLKVRSLAAVLFLMLRGLSVGITIYAPSLILSTILGWNITLTTIFISALVASYTITGGARAISLTQKYQMAVIMAGMLAAGGLAFAKLPDEISFGDTFSLAGEMGKLNLINLKFDLTDRYNIWSGLIGGLFLFLSYFGADQSQVGRYLGGKSITESRLGLIFNGLLKIPLQFIILYIGILIFVFYQFYQPPVFHNTMLKEKAMTTTAGPEIKRLETDYTNNFDRKKERTQALVRAIHEKDENAKTVAKNEIAAIQKSDKEIRMKVREAIARAVPGSNTQDKDYVFIHFVISRLPHGLIGVLFAVVFCAAMSSTSSELNSLASTTTVDIYKRSVQPTADDLHYVRASKVFTAIWALMAIAFASLANQSENLIQFVNIVGSLFYGTILGIFITAFYVRYVKSTAVFYAAIIAELFILYLYFFRREQVAFLLYNIIGCGIVVVLSICFQRIGTPGLARR